MYRGVKMDLTTRYVEGEEVIWWAFSSATATVKVWQSRALRVCV